MHLHLLTSFLFLFFLLLPQTVTTFFSIKYFASHKNLAFASFLTNVLIKNDVRAQLDFFFLYPLPLLPSFLDSSSFGVFFLPLILLYFFLPGCFSLRPVSASSFRVPPTPHPGSFFCLSFHLEPVKKVKKKLSH